MAEKEVKKKYTEAVGRRKTAIARVRILSSHEKKGGEIIVNEKSLQTYFTLEKQRKLARAPFQTLSLDEPSLSIKVRGGGSEAQAEAIRLGIARALVIIDPSYRPRLKAAGFLKRDPRMVERKKPGLRKARRPQQWRKR